MGHTHTLLTPTMIAKEALRLLKNNLVMGNLVYRDYESEFPGAPKKGGTVQIRKPVKFRVTKSRVRVTSTITEAYVTMTVSTQAHVSWQFSMIDLTLSIEEYSNRYIRPAAAALANQVDADLCGLYDDVYNQIYESTGYVTPHTFMVLGKAMQRLDEEAAPPDERVVVFDPAAHWSFANALSNWNFKEGGEQALRKGFLGRIANAEIYMDQNIKVHTMGNVGTDTSEQVAASIQIASSAVSGGGLPAATNIGQGMTQVQHILFQGFPHESTVAMPVGSVFTIAGCYAVNPMSGESTGTLRQFVVTTDVDATATTAGGALADVLFQPDMIHTGPYKTVDTIPAVAAKMTILGNSKRRHPVNLAFHKNAFALCMVPIEKPDSTWGDTATEDGISITVVKAFDIDQYKETIRLDILYGVKTIYPELATRIMGAEA